MFTINANHINRVKHVCSNSESSLFVPQTIHKLKYNFSTFCAGALPENRVLINIRVNEHIKRHIKYMFLP